MQDSWNYIAHEKAARNLERLWGHEIIPGAHIDPKKEKSDKSKQVDHDRHQAQSSEMSRADRVAQIMELYQQSDGVKAFTSALEQSGYVIAQGDRRDYVLVDGGGRVFSLPRYIENVKTKDVRKFMESIDIKHMASVENAKITAHENREAKEAVENKKNAKQDFQKAGKNEENKDTKQQFMEASNDQAELRRKKARRAVAREQGGAAWKEYGQSLKSRLSGSASIARNLTQNVKDRFRACADKAKNVFNKWKQGMSRGRGEADSRDTKPLAQKFSEVAKSKVERAKTNIKSPEKKDHPMIDEAIHPMPEFVADDVEVRNYAGAFGQIESISLERFYWVHLDWYEKHGLLKTEKGLEGVISELDNSRENDMLEDCIRVYVDHYMIPQAIRSAIPPFDEISEDERIEITREAQVFRES